MGIYERDYIRPARRGPFATSPGSVIMALIMINVGCWFLQIMTRDRTGSSGVTDLLACRAEDIFGGFPQVWKLLTANFAHDPRSPWHLFFNMLLLFFFGRELEEMYGKKEFGVFYLTAGLLAVLAEVISLQAASSPAVPVLGASGAVMAVLVLYALYFPRRQVLFMFLFPIPIWLLCIVLVLVDLSGATAPRSGVAHLAHLAGAGYGFLFRIYDLRWVHLRSWARSLWAGGGRQGRQRQRRLKATAARSSGREGSSRVGAEDSAAIARRIDELLRKIHEGGMGSLTEEEYRFLTENSKRYRSS